MQQIRTFSRNVADTQLAFLVFSIFIISLLLLLALLSGNVYYFVMTVIVALLLVVPNLFLSKFFEIEFDDEAFVIKNYFRPKRTIQLAGFEKVVRMDTILLCQEHPILLCYSKVVKNIFPGKDVRTNNVYFSR
jgi:multisubunit Na+/H+ antiporter MnhF subunit